jgi:hypothetical protein
MACMMRCALRALSVAKPPQKIALEYSLVVRGGFGTPSHQPLAACAYHVNGHGNVTLEMVASKNRMFNPRGMDIDNVLITTKVPCVGREPEAQSIARRNEYHGHLETQSKACRTRGGLG